MKVSRPHKALPQVPPPRDQSQSASPTTSDESPPQSVSSVVVPETTPVGSPTTNNAMATPSSTSKWRSVKVQADQATTRTLATSNDSNSSANGTEPANTPPSNENNTKSQRVTVGDISAALVKEDEEAKNKDKRVILDALEKQGLTERDIWDGDHRVYPILAQMKQQMLEIAQDNHESCTINFIFDDVPELVTLNIRNQAFKLNYLKPVYQVIGLICKKFKIEGSRRFTLATPKGSLLDDELDLATYGFGSLLRHWELRMVPKSDELIQKQKSAGGAGYVVSIYLPPIASFYGASSQKKLIQAITPTGQIIELLCQRFQVPDPQNYGLASMDGQLLSRKEGLGFYGLGTKFKQMSVRLVELSSLPGRSVLPPGEKRKSLRFTSEYVWTQIDDSLTVPQARDAIRDLDNQLGNQINEKRDLKQQIHSLKKQIIDLLKNRKDLKEAYIKLKEEKLHSDELNLELMEGTKELAQQMQDLNEEKLQMKIDLDSRLMEAEDRIDNLQRRFEEERLSNEKLQLTLEQQKNDYENLLHERADEYNAKTEALSLKHQGEIQRQEEIVADLNEKLKDCEAKLARSEEANKVQQERIKEVEFSKEAANAETHKKLEIIKEQYATRLTKAEDQIKVLHGQAEAARADMNKYKREATVKIQEKENIEKELKQLSNQFKSLEVKFTNISNERQNLLTKTKEAMDQAEQLRKENQNLTSRATKAEHLASGLEADITKVKSGLAREAQEKEQWKTRSDQIEKKFHLLKQDRDNLVEELQKRGSPTSSTTTSAEISIKEFSIPVPAAPVPPPSGSISIRIKTTSDDDERDARLLQDLSRAKNTLRKSELTHVKRPTLADPNNPLNTVLRTGLSKRFIDLNMNDVEDLGSLDDDNFYVKNDNEKDWD